MFRSFSKVFNLVKRKPGFTLDQSYYVDQTIFSTEIEKIWKKNWLFAGHKTSLKNIGDYFLFECKIFSLKNSHE